MARLTAHSCIRGATIPTLKKIIRFFVVSFRELNEKQYQEEQKHLFKKACRTFWQLDGDYRETALEVMRKTKDRYYEVDDEDYFEDDDEEDDDDEEE